MVLPTKIKQKIISGLEIFKNLDLLKEKWKNSDILAKVMKEWEGRLWVLNEEVIDCIDFVKVSDISI